MYLYILIHALRWRFRLVESHVGSMFFAFSTVLELTLVSSMSEICEECWCLLEFSRITETE